MTAPGRNPDTGNPERKHIESGTITHIVWDWNGTIFGDSVALIESTIAAFAAAGLPPITREQYQRHHVQPIPLFYDRLVGRSLSDAEQQGLAEAFQEAYLRVRADIPLTADARPALRRWAAAGHGQSLLSMYPHEKLLPLVRAAGIAELFVRVDGLVGTESGWKAPHLRNHLAAVGVPREQVLMIGDSTDDARAAAECGVACLLYHAGADALHAREHFAELDVPIVTSLDATVADVLAGRQDLGPARSTVD